MEKGDLFAMIVIYFRLLLHVFISVFYKEAKEAVCVDVYAHEYLNHLIGTDHVVGNRPQDQKKIAHFLKG